jgi:hypothetical protein
MTFDEQVAALRGKVLPKQSQNNKADCTPEEWAGHLDYAKAWRKANPDKARAAVATWRKTNPAKDRAWKEANPEKRRASVAAWRKTNREKDRAATKAWRKANPDKVRASVAAAKKKRMKNDPVYRMMRCLRVRQYQFFKGINRPASMVRDMGCTQEFFKQHITSQFHSGMTMDNYGTVWHLDHIYPLARANIVDNPIHFLAAANWRNLQPMLGPENIEKSDTITPEAQALFDSLVQEFTRKESVA